MIKNKKDKIWTLDFTFLMISLLAVSCANYYFASSMAIYAKIISNSAEFASLVTASFYIGSVGMRFINGTMVQKYGAHKLMLVGAMLCAISCLAHNIAGTIGILILFRVLHGAGYSIFSTAGGTAASYMVPKKRLAEGMGYFTIGNVLAMAIGPSIALSVVSNNTLPQFHTLFYIASTICMASFILVCFIKSDRTPIFTGTKKDLQNQNANLPKTFLGFEKGVVLPAAISFLMSFSYSPVIVYLSLYGMKKGFQNIGIAFTMYAVGLLISRLFTGRLSDRFGADCIMIPSYICGSTSLVLIALCSSIWQLYAAMILLGLCIGAYNPQINVFCISRCSKQRRGTATAAFNGASDMGFALGSCITGVFIEHFGFMFTFLNGAAVCIITMIFYIFTLSSLKEKIKIHSIKTS